MIRLTGKRRDILRLAVQSSLAGAFAYLAIRWTGTGEAFLAVISAVLVLEPDRDETLKSARSRMAGTLIGTVVGVAALAATSQRAVTLSLAVVMLIMGAIAAWKPSWRYGVVAAAALAVGSDAGFLETAQVRGIAIFLGAGIGFTVGALVWPEGARVRARRQMREALSFCRRLLDRTLSAAIEGEEDEIDGLHTDFARSLSAARDTAGSIRLGGSEAVRHYRDAVHSIERLWHALIILDRARERKQHARLPLREKTTEQIRRIQAATCDALGAAEKFESIPPDELDTLDRLCREVWSDARVDPEAEDELENVGLVFGLSEIARHMREIDDAIGAIRAAR